MSATKEKSPVASTKETPPPSMTANADNDGSPDSAQEDRQDSPATPSNAPAGFVMPPGMAPIAGMQFVPYFPPLATNPEQAAEGSSQVPQGQPMMIHPAFLQQMYTYPYAGMVASGMKLKRKQVKNACTNCQKACKKCDDERPCGRCVKYGISDDCSDSVRKERRKGIKRGSYKKKSGEELDPAAQLLPAYSAQLYSQWAAAAMSAASAASASGKPTEGAAYYPYFIAAPIPQGEGGEGSANAAIAGANAYMAQMYYGGYPPGYIAAAAAAAPSGDQTPASSPKKGQGAKGEQNEEDELRNDDMEEEEQDEEIEESPKRKRVTKRRGAD
ncbi:hypothetical protein FRC15_007730 [Serendipita sp. 397]|nr:hypothetical protein FRC15_007730 [Serendipita sp. 397]KAG8801144.1 hypothetical protein FRC16_001203 [Serendipita sp. 398]